MASEPTSSEESNMSQSGPRNFYCHQCSSRTRISIEEFTCSSCGSGFIEEIVESDADESRDLGQGGNSDDPWAHDTETDGEPEMFGPHSVIEHIFAQALGPGLHVGQVGSGNGPTVIRTSRRSVPGAAGGASRGPGGTSIFVGSSGGSPGDQFLQSLISNLTGMQGPGQFQFMMGGPPGSNVMYGNPGDYAWGRGGFDAIVTQLLNQMEGAGPPRMEKDDINSLPSITVTKQHIDQKAQCSVCWEDFKLDESVNQLQCEHIFHKDCITPWLELHATCPVCRKPQNEAAAAHSRQAQNEANSERDSNVNVNSSSLFGSSSNEYNDSPMTDDRTSQDATPSTSISASARQPNSTTNSSSLGSNEPSTVPAGAEAGYSLGNPLSSIFNQFFGNASPSSSRTSRNQAHFNLPSSSTTSNTNPSQSNAFSQATSSSPDVNGEINNRGQSPIPPLTDVSSSSSTDTGDNINSTTSNGSRSSLPSADGSTGSNNTRLNTTPGSNISNSTTSRSAPTDFHDLDLE